MINNTLLNLNEDRTLSDLVPQDFMFDDLLHVDNMTIPAMHPDITEWGRKIDSLTIECVGFILSSGLSLCLF